MPFADLAGKVMDNSFVVGEWTGLPGSTKATSHYLVVLPPAPAVSKVAPPPNHSRISTKSSSRRRRRGLRPSRPAGHPLEDQVRFVFLLNLGSRVVKRDCPYSWSLASAWHENTCFPTTICPSSLPRPARDSDSLASSERACLLLLYWTSRG